MLLPFEELPQEFQNDAVKKYYDILKNNKSSLAAKRALDIVICIFLLVFLIVPIIILAFCVKLTSRGPVMYKRLDEIPQIFNVLKGDMSIVGTRPEVPKYVDKYSPQMYATLLMPAGITSLASIKFKNEDRMLETSTNIDEDYVGIILPKKMHYNLLYIKSFNFKTDLFLMFKTISEVLFH